MAPPDDALNASTMTPFGEIAELVEVSRPDSVRTVGPEGVRVYAHGENGAIPIRFAPSRQTR